MNIQTKIKRFLRQERDALDASIGLVDQGFAKAVQLMHRMKGKAIVTGIGKSGLVGQKIAATLSSTGTSAVYMHSTDAIHGDLGMINSGDVFIAISNSGYTPETLEVVPHAKRIGAKVVALVNDADSQLARMADAVLCTGVASEAGHLNLAPTSSALVSMAFGDALASVLAELRGFKAEDFAMFHPGGQLGRKLLLKVCDLMHGGDENPLLRPDASLDEVFLKLTETRLGGVSIVSDLQRCRLAGIITEGDIRKALLNRDRAESGSFFDLKAKDIMTKKPICVHDDALAVDAFILMENRPSQIYVLPVIDGKRRVVGMIRLHDLVEIGFKPEDRQ